MRYRLCRYMWGDNEIYNPSNIFVRAGDWPEHVTWPNILQLKLGNI